MTAAPSWSLKFGTSAPLILLKTSMALHCLIINIRLFITSVGLPKQDSAEKKDLNPNFNTKPIRYGEKLENLLKCLKW